MARLEFTDSFEHWDTTRPHSKWSALSVIGDVSVSTSFGRNGKGARILSGNYEAFTTLGTDQTNGNGSGMLEKIFPGFSDTQWTVGLGFRFSDDIGFLNMPIVSIIDTDHLSSYSGSYYETQCCLIFTPEQRLAFAAGDWEDFPGNKISSYSPPLKRGIFYHLEVQFVLSTSATGSVVLKIDGKTVISQSSVTTIGGSGSNGKGFRILHPKMRGWAFAAATRNYDIDDVYVISGGGVATDVKIESHLPNGAGAVTQWTPSAGANYQNVDEAPADENTTYNTASAVGNIDTFTFPALATTAGTVHGLGINGVCRNFDSASVIGSGIVRQASSNYASGTQRISNTEYGGVYMGHLNNPATSNKFTISEAGSDEFGIKRDV